MRSLRRAHIVVVTEGDQGLVLADQLRMMDLARVSTVKSVAIARWLCQSGGADACVVTIGHSIPDAAPAAPVDAPSRYTRVPSIAVVPALTPYLRQLARQSGYMAAVPASLPPRTLYRRLGAVLQQKRAAREKYRRGAIKQAMIGLPGPVLLGKPVLH